MKICPKISQTLTICGAKNNPKPRHFCYVFLLRALSRLFRQILIKIKLGNSDLYKFCVKKLFIEFLDFAPYLLYNTKKESTWQNSILGSYKISERINVLSWKSLLPLNAGVKK